MQTWYVQFSAKGYSQLKKLDLPSYITYDLGAAKYKVLPCIDDAVILLADKCELAHGVIVDSYTRENAVYYVMLVSELNPIYTGRSYRRNWTKKIE